ncbi:AI-2E family transporter [Nocardioides sp. YIM 152315]|uniref:AI-2E family transporter n=1 Tax=Nocardioides sp. YIM 152315 TaxID=3031760 RepID=UPI0023DCC6E9|nr:AI-2E family transporter [Nocardioides sp. YIM 152315]MDF1604546.1 AI-2E family transporter [Nocardioides sp. YIM 152315]
MSRRGCALDHDGPTNDGRREYDVPITSEPARSALPRGVLVLVGLAATVVVVAGMKASADILAPTFLALVLTILAHPLRRWLDDWMPSWAASLVCTVAIYALVLGLAMAVIVSVARFATLLPEYTDELERRIDDLTSWLTDVGVGQAEIDKVGSSFDLGQLGGFIGSLLSELMGLVSNLFFILALVLFMTMDGGSFPRQLERARSARPAVVEALGDFAKGTRRYLAVSTVFGLIVAVFDTIALALLGVPAPFLWGLLAFITNYIPNIGFVIGLIPPAILALLEGGPGLMLAVIAVYCVLNVVIQSVIQPKVVGDAVGLSTTLSFVSLVFWAWVVGPLGALLAIPLTLFAKALLVDIDPATRWMRPLISNKDEAGDAGVNPGS